MVTRGKAYLAMNSESLDISEPHRTSQAHRCKAHGEKRRGAWNLRTSLEIVGRHICRGGFRVDLHHEWANDVSCLVKSLMTTITVREFLGLPAAADLDVFGLTRSGILDQVMILGDVG